MSYLCFYNSKLNVALSIEYKNALQYAHVYILEKFYLL